MKPVGGDHPQVAVERGGDLGIRRIHQQGFFWRTALPIRAAVGGNPVGALW
jgi:hypothetical protein